MATSLLGPTYYSSATSVNFTPAGATSGPALLIDGSTGSFNALSGSGTLASGSTTNFDPPPIFTITNVLPITTSAFYIANDVGVLGDGASSIVVRLYNSAGTLIGTESMTVPSAGYTGTMAFSTTYTGVAKWELQVNSTLPGGGGAANALQIREIGLFGDQVAPICFGRGTLIRTDRGLVAVEDLRPGDRLLTADHGYQPVRWVKSRTYKVGGQAETPAVVPVRIRTNALGPGRPDRDLILSPQHRVMVNLPPKADAESGEEVFVPAKHLCSLEGIENVTNLGDVEYWHVLLDTHDIVLANNLETETLFLGPQTLSSFDGESYAEVNALFPEFSLETVPVMKVTARRVVKGNERRQFLRQLSDRSAAKQDADISPARADRFADSAQG